VRLRIQKAFAFYTRYLIALTENFPISTFNRSRSIWEASDAAGIGSRRICRPSLRLSRLRDSLGFELRTSGHGFGCLYVLEGSALGGRVISKRVKQTLGLGPATGGAYFHGLGRHTASHWSDFLTALNMIPANSAMGADAEAGAIATFLAFRRAISQFGHRKSAPTAPSRAKS
jgi:heme oxygenase